MDYGTPTLKPIIFRKVLYIWWSKHDKDFRFLNNKIQIFLICSPDTFGKEKNNWWNSNVFTYRRLYYNENAAQMEKRVRSKQGKKLLKVMQVLWNFHQLFNKRSTLLSKRLTTITKLYVFHIFSLQCSIYLFNFFLYKLTNNLTF